MLQWDAMMNLVWSTNIYTDVACLRLAGSDALDNLKLFAGNLVTQQIIVGDLRRRRKAEAGLEVADTVPGKAPFSVSSSCDILCCTSMQDFSVLVYTSKTGTGWREAARLQHHSDQVSTILISSASDYIHSCSDQWSLDQQ